MGVDQQDSWVFICFFVNELPITYSISGWYLFQRPVFAQSTTCFHYWEGKRLLWIGGAARRGEVIPEVDASMLTHPNELNPVSTSSTSSTSVTSLQIARAWSRIGGVYLVRLTRGSGSCSLGGGALGRNMASLCSLGIARFIPAPDAAKKVHVH